ncbi:hypothetical protein CR513_40610, partial [Mucuna pruriens]
MVISIIIVVYKVERMLVDQGNLVNVLFWPAIQKLGFSESSLEECLGMLIGFTGEQVKIRGVINLETILDMSSTMKVVKMRFMVVNIPTSYNVIFDRLALNRLWAIVSIAYLCMKYLVDNLVGVIQADQRIARRCYDEKLDPRFDREDARLQSDEDLKEVQVGLESHQRTKIEASLDVIMEGELVRLLKENRDTFAWTLADMSGIDLGFLFHRLSISLGGCLVSQKKRRLGEEKKKAIKVETAKLL